MSIYKHSFNKVALNYHKYANIQDEIAKILIDLSLNKHINSILDLGAGSGNVALNVSQKLQDLVFNIELFVGIDNSASLLSIHPKKLANIKKIELYCEDFNDYKFGKKFDLLISSSSLHWALDLESIFSKINPSKKFSKIAFSIFTNKSLASLHNFLGTTSPLQSSDNLIKLLNKYFIGEVEIKEFRENFSSREEYLAHLKNCGLFGGGNLSFCDKKRLKFEIPFLEARYEVLFFTGKIK
ncbi:MAG: methyltransferase domain-containing protein [Helicobacteraceae bacterium]|nr:methyltransferase domain-containing protein [Helicobacteraceae bacterium]